jgi:hypothetical protein
MVAVDGLSLNSVMEKSPIAAVAFMAVSRKIKEINNDFVFICLKI